MFERQANCCQEVAGNIDLNTHMHQQAYNGRRAVPCISPCADLEEALIVSQGVNKQAVQGGSARQQGSQHRTIRQHQLLQYAKVMLARLV